MTGSILARAVGGAIVAVALTLPLTAFADESWPQFRGPRGDGSSDSTGVPRTWSETKNVRWKTAIHDRGWSSPVVLGNQVWLTTATPDGKKLYAVCVARDTGAIVHDLELFQVETPDEIHTTNSYASPSPVLEGDHVWVSFGTYGTACLERRTGKTVWTRRDLPCNHWRGPGSSPILWKHLYICHYDGYDYQYVVALDKRTGDTVWKTNRSNDYGTDDGDFKKAYSTPIVIEAAGRTQMISAGSKAAFSYDPLTGEESWQVRFSRFSSTARPLWGHGLVIVNTGFGKGELLAVRPDGKGDVTKSHVEWHVTRGVGSKTSSLLIGDLIYSVVDRGGIVSCLDAKTGEQVWTGRLGGNFSASPIVVDGAMVFCDEAGKPALLAPGREFRKLGVNQLDEGCMSSPAVAGKAIFLRTRTHLYRLEKR